ncbi:MAG: hypothetical protein ABI488_18630, partial [Polyangiaceae bacterium]
GGAGAGGDANVAGGSDAGDANVAGGSDAGGVAGSSGAGSGGSESGCTQSGGVVTTGLCCNNNGTHDFPNQCLVGACTCAPTSSREIKMCNCPVGFCFDGSACVTR